MTVSNLRSIVSLLTVALVAVAGSALAADWPQWRGPERDGRSPETGLLAEWPDGGPPLAWSAEGLGSGFSSVAVVGDRVYTMGDLDDGQYVLALSSSDGSAVWKRRVDDTWGSDFPGPRSTPTVDGDRLFVLTTGGSVAALATADGAELWRRALPREFGGRLMKAMGTTDWRWVESPLVDGDRVVVTPGGREAALVALHREDGRELWRSTIPDLGPEGADGAGYSSVVVSEATGVRQYVQLLGRGVVGVDAETGRYLWGYNRVANDIANIPTPLVLGDRVFASSGYGTGSALLELSAADGGVAAREVYFLPGDTMQNHHGGLILDGDHVYTGTGHNKGFPLAVEVDTGEIAWGPIRNDGSGSSALAYADGRLYFRFQNGLVILVEASSEGYEERGRLEIPDVSSPSWSHPVISGGRLFLREQDRLWVYDLAAAAPVEEAPEDEAPPAAAAEGR